MTSARKSKIDWKRLTLSLSAAAAAAGIPIASLHDAIRRKELSSTKGARIRSIRLADFIRYLGARPRIAADSEREKLATARTEEIAMRVAEKRKALMNVEDVRQMFMLGASLYVNGLDNLRGRASPRLLHRTEIEDVYAVFDEEIRVIRTHLADYFKDCADKGVAEYIQMTQMIDRHTALKLLREFEAEFGKVCERQLLDPEFLAAVEREPDRSKREALLRGRTSLVVAWVKDRERQLQMRLAAESVDAGD